MALCEITMNNPPFHIIIDEASNILNIDTIAGQWIYMRDVYQISRSKISKSSSYSIEPSKVPMSTALLWVWCFRMTILLLLMDAKTSCRVETLAKTCSSRTSYLKSAFLETDAWKKDYFISQSGAALLFGVYLSLAFFKLKRGSSKSS